MNSFIEEQNRLQPGSVLDQRFAIDCEIGSGAMGVVYKAIQQDIDRVVAIKMLHSSRLTDGDSTARFQREAQLVSTLNHKNIIRVYSSGVTSNYQPFFVMDYLQGKTLADLSEDTSLKGIEAQQRFLSIFIQCCNALTHAHKRGIIHRDVKPRNIMLVEEDGQEVVKLVDFGIARMLPGENAQMQQLTRTGFLVGSPIYMSPEQCSAHGLDERSDIYSLGCVMYEIVTGKPPFSDAVATGILYKHMTETPALIDASNAKFPLPIGLDAVIFKCLAKQKEDRYQACDQVTEDLMLLKDGLPPVNSTISFTRTLIKKEPKKYNKLAVLCVVLATVLIIVSYQTFKTVRAAHLVSVKRQADEITRKAFKHRYRKRYDQAEQGYAKAFDLYKQDPANEKQAAGVLFSRAHILAKTGKSAEAKPLYLMALDMKTQLFGADSQEVVEIEAELGRLLSGTDAKAEAIPRLSHAIEGYMQHSRVDLIMVIPLLETLIDCQESSNHFEDAARSCQQLIALQQKNKSIPEVIAGNLEKRAALLQKIGKTAEAAGELAKAKQLRATAN